MEERERKRERERKEDHEMKRGRCLGPSGGFELVSKEKKSTVSLLGQHLYREISFPATTAG